MLTALRTALQAAKEAADADGAIRLLEQARQDGVAVDEVSAIQLYRSLAL